MHISTQPLEAGPWTTIVKAGASVAQTMAKHAILEPNLRQTLFIRMGKF